MTLPRPFIPLWVQLEAALHQLGIDPKTAELDHDPALGLRERTDVGGYIPDANNPHYLKWRDPVAHAKKTRGVKATTAGSDVHLIAKGKRIRRKEAAHRLTMEPVRGLIDNGVVLGTVRKATIPSRANPWPKARKIASRPFRPNDGRSRS